MKQLVTIIFKVKSRPILFHNNSFSSTKVEYKAQLYSGPLATSIQKVHVASARDFSGENYLNKTAPHDLETRNQHRSTAAY